MPHKIIGSKRLCVDRSNIVQSFDISLQKLIVLYNIWPIHAKTLRADYFTDKEKPIVEKLFVLSPKLKLGYQFSRELSGIFDSHITPEVAKEKMEAWILSVTSSDLTCFNSFIKTLIEYQEQITNYFNA